MSSLLGQFSAPAFQGKPSGASWPIRCGILEKRVVGEGGTGISFSGFGR